jgi:hypothetical protein
LTAVVALGLHRKQQKLLSRLQQPQAMKMRIRIIAMMMTTARRKYFFIFSIQSG